jgi:tRNA 5-methylaminomethyl-2-thiouridine biosynthesis bifunctional protein
MPHKVKVAIIGAGIAGLTIALKLSQADIAVTVFEKNNQAALEASYGPVCITYPRFDAVFNRYTNFYLHAYKKALGFYANYPQFYLQNGLILFQRGDQSKKFAALLELIDRSLLQAVEASNYCDSVSGMALFYPRSGCVFTKDLCDYIVKDIDVRFMHEVSNITRNSGEWHIYNISGDVIGVYTHVIIASAYKALQLLGSLKEMIYPVRGQSSSTTEYFGYSGRHILSFPHLYITPQLGDAYYFGATYERTYMKSDICMASHQQNLMNLVRYFPAAIDLKPNILGGAAGIRCFSKDYLPLIGPMPAYDNLYLNIAHGARGVVSSPIAAEIILDSILQHEPNDVAKLVLPYRLLQV